jgi:hypothetical protein
MVFLLKCHRVFRPWTGRKRRFDRLMRTSDTPANGRAILRRQPAGRRAPGLVGLIGLAAIVASLVAAPSADAAVRPSIPLPRPRPAEAPVAKPPAQTAADKSAAAPPAESTPPPPSACRVALTEDIAIAPSLPPIKGPGSCGGDDIVRLEAVVLADKTRVALKPAATLRCTMATAVADWVRTDVAKLAASLDTVISEIDNFDSFECRGRNRVSGALLSEHGKANALDVRSLKFADGRVLGLTDRTSDRALRESVLHSVCARFSTVLGPDSDWYHEDHIHLDLAERRSNYRICQWDVLDPLPVVAPLMPVARPEEAPKLEADQKQGGREQPAAGTADDRTEPGTKPEGRPSVRGGTQAASVKSNAAPADATKSRTKSKGRRSAAPQSLDLRSSF